MPSGQTNENQSSFCGDKTLTEQDHQQWAQTSKFCMEEVENDYSEKQRIPNNDYNSPIDNSTVEKAYESKKIQEYAERVALDI